MIFYFSATGNCKLAAETIAEETGDRCVSISEAWKTQTLNYDLSKEKQFGIVTPTYFWGLPSVVLDFMDQVRFQLPEKHPYTFQISTYGTTIGQTGRLMEKELKKHGLKVDAFFSIKMVDVWTKIFDLSNPEKNRKLEEEGCRQIAEASRKIKRCEKGNFAHDKMPMFMVKPFYQLYEGQRKTKGFTVDSDLCCGCGLCAYQCPVEAIEIKDAHPVWVKDKCALCLGCLNRCPNHAIEFQHKTYDNGQYTNYRSMPTVFEEPMEKLHCVQCGQCLSVRPDVQLVDRKAIQHVKEAIADPKKKVVAFAAPSVRASLGEEFGLPYGTNVESKLPAAMHAAGFQEAYDMAVTADLTIVEEATELIHRLQNDEPLPMFTSCCPGWVKFAEQEHPNLLPNVSTCRSPQQMFGSLLKNKYGEDLFVVSITPCTAKKMERIRSDVAGDVDAVLTARDFAAMLKEKDIFLPFLPDENFDEPFGITSGAGVIFGASGGVMEAALRTAAVMMDADFKKVSFSEVRGDEPVKKAVYQIGDQKVSVAVASGLKNAEKLCREAEAGSSPYQFIEIMTCPGGCVNGGGQPLAERSLGRANALYDEDAAKKYRRSHDTPVMHQLYKDYLGAPGSEKAEAILHTHYQPISQ